MIEEEKYAEQLSEAIEAKVQLLPQEVPKGTPCELNFEGDEELTKIKYKRLYSKQQIAYWHEELKKACPKVPNDILLQTLDLFSTHPHVFEQVTAEFKADPTCFLKDEPIKWSLDK